MGLTQRQLVTGFPLMPHGQDRRGFAVRSIKHHVAAVAKIDWPFSIVVFHIIDGATNVRLMRQYLQVCAVLLHCATCSMIILGREKAIQALHIRVTLPWRGLVSKGNTW